MKTWPGILEYYDYAEPSSEPVGADPAADPVLHFLNDRIAGAASLDEVMNLVFDHTRELCACDRLGLAFIEDDTRIVARWSRADYEPIRLKTGYGEGFAGSSLEALLRERRVRVIHDLPAYLEQRPESVSTRLLVEEGVKSSMTCPLYVDERPVAFFFRSSREAGAYKPVHFHRHVRLAARLAQAVEKVWRIEQLEEANRAYMEMLGFVSHELKGPLGVIQMNAETLRDGYLGAIEEKQRQAVERMIRKTTYLTNLVKDYLDLARTEGGQLKAEFVDGVHFIQDVLDPSMDVVREQFEASGMHLEKEYDEQSSITADAGLLRIIAVNLLNNAVKYGRAGGKLRIECKSNEAGLLFRVWNEGPGFPLEMKGQLFRRFSRLKTPELLKRKGTGVGLYTCWRIAKLHGGSIDADSREGEWAAFTLHLPPGGQESKQQA